MNQVQNLILSGGAIFGVAYGSVLSVLDEIGALSNLKGLAGTSVGAWVACLLAVGYSGAEIRHMMLNEFTYSSLIGEMSPLRMLLSSTAYGLNDGNQMLQMIRTKIRDKVGNDKLTFRQLKDQLGKDLKVYVTNLNLGLCQELSCATEPNMEIALAVRASTSMPIIFDPVLYKGDFLVDGGMLNNFPKTAFPPENTIGFIFVQSLSADPSQKGEPTREPINTRFDFLNQVLICTMRDSKSHAREVAGLAICEIETGQLTSRDFQLTQEERMHLDWLGYKSICIWLQRMAASLSDRDNEIIT